MINEFQLIDKIRCQIPKRLQGRWGIGDDAAILAGDSSSWLVTSDVIVDGVDFKRTETRPELVGRKALAVNLSDIAAMGGKPIACVISLGLPSNISTKWVERFYKGFARLAAQYQTLCVGGDISRSKTLFISVALLGKTLNGKFVARKGCRPGDMIGVTGRLGGSIRGRHFSFVPRIAEGQFLLKNYHPTSMLDISDGFIQDLGHLLKASNVGAQVELSDIPVSQEAIKSGRGRRMKALQNALTDGEDFELLFTVSKRLKKKLEVQWKRKFPRVPLSWVGQIQNSPKKIIWTENKKQIRLPFKMTGYSHF